MYLWDSIT